MIQERILHRQIERLERRITKLARTSSLLFVSRLVIIGLGLISAQVVFLFAGGSWFWMPLVVFAVPVWYSVRLYRQVQQSISWHRIWQAQKEAHIARMQLDWASMPPTLDVSAESRRPIEIDLNLVGERSLHRLIDTSASLGGSNRLRDWLSTTNPNIPEILLRQKLVKELLPRTMFRERLSASGRIARTGDARWTPEIVNKWLLGENAVPNLTLWLGLLIGLAIANIVLFTLDQLNLVGSWWLISGVAYGLINLGMFQRTQMAFGSAIRLRNALEQLLTVFRHLESYSYYDSPT